MSRDTSHNFFASNRAILVIPDFDGGDLQIQNFNIPGVNGMSALAANPFTDRKIPGDKIEYEELSVTFRIDEELKNWSGIYNWIKGVVYPQSNDQFQNTAFRKRDIKLITHSNANNVQSISITYRDAFPINVSSIEVTVQETDYIPTQATALFAYQDFVINQE